MYKTIAGDTFKKISIKSYGDASGENLIISANPGIFEPLNIGTSINVPREISAANKLIGATGEQLTIKVNFRELTNWSSVQINKNLDAIDTATFTAPFDADLLIDRKTFQPLSYNPSIIYIGDDKIFEGVQISTAISASENSTTLSSSSYSRPGVLADCTPTANQKTQFTKSNLEIIASNLAAPFGISVVFLDGSGASFDSVSIKPTEKIMGFLIGLAKQRGLIISSNQNGDLVFKKQKAGDVIADLTEGVSPLISVTQQISPQNYFSHITALEKAKTGSSGSKFTAINDLLKYSVRPMSFAVSDSSDGDSKTAALAKVGRMFGNAINYTVKVSTWRSPTGKLWQPGDLINLTAPDAMVYNKYKFMIKSVVLNANSNSETADIALVLPGSFNSEIPLNLPWD